MKKVRCTMGPAGAVPAVLGLAMLPAMATAPHPAKPLAKTVSLRHGAMRTTADCNGKNFHSSHTGSAVLRFWSTPEGADMTCIGTVQGYNHTGIATSHRVRIYQSIPTHKNKVFSTGKKAGSSFNFPVRKSYDNKIQICAKWWASGGLSLSTICSSVG